MIDRVLFVGSKELGLAALRSMHSVAPGTITGILTLNDEGDRRSAMDGFQEFASNHGLPLRIATKRVEAEQIVREFHPQLCIVVCWYWIIEECLLNDVPQGFIGVHNSLLPRYRGGSPLVWQLIQGESEVGFSIFTLTAGMDEGPIWAAHRLHVHADEHIGDLLPRMEAAIVSELGLVYPNILTGSIKPRPQDSKGATYCMARHPEDGLLEWNLPAEKVFNQIRAQSAPYPGAFSYLNGALFRFWRAKRFDCPWHGQPGQIARIGPEGVVVIAGDNRAVMLTEVETGDMRDTASRLIKSYRRRFSAYQDEAQPSQ